MKITKKELLGRVFAGSDYQPSVPLDDIVTRTARALGYEVVGESGLPERLNFVPEGTCTEAAITDDSGSRLIITNFGVGGRGRSGTLLAELVRRYNAKPAVLTALATFRSRVETLWCSLGGDELDRLRKERAELISLVRAIEAAYEDPS